MKDVAVLGVGMHRFGMWAEKSNADMAREAGLAALRDAGLSFRDVQAAYVGYIFAPVMSAVRTMKEFGLTGIPVQRVENASATGSAAFREACFAVESGRHDVVMVLGFDKMTSMIQSSGRNTDRRGSRTRSCPPPSSPCGPPAACTSAARSPSTSPPSPPRTGTTAR